MHGKLDPEDRVMTGLPEFFQQTCDKPYDRHDYKLVYTDGHSKTFDSYDEYQASWFQTANMFLSHCEVLDKKTKQKTLKGFM
jgi:hypothetical protein